MVASSAALTALLPRLAAAEPLAVDTEADSLHAYPEKICLIQVAGRGFAELVDPLSGLDLAPLWGVFAGRRLIFHGADYDLRMLRRGHGFVPSSIFDTMLAARLLGHERFGMDALAEGLLGVTMEKRSQKADWGRRPLTERMVIYALSDVELLLPLAALLEDRLRELGRAEWHAEMCAALVADCAVPRETDPDRVWRLKGSTDLSPRELAVLRELWRWREGVAREKNRPPYFVLSHEVLIQLARHAVNRSVPYPRLPRHFSPRREDQVHAAMRAGLAVPPGECPGPLPVKRYHPGEVEQKRQKQLEARRDEAARRLGIDASLIANRATLGDLARDESNAAALMRWQRELLGL